MTDKRRLHALEQEGVVEEEDLETQLCNLNNLSD
jgi:hypothetical protein